MLLLFGGGSGGVHATSLLLFLWSLVVTTLTTTLKTVDAADSSYTAVPYANYQKYWTDAGDVLKNLDNYQALWIKPHGCV